MAILRRVRVNVLVKEGILGAILLIMGVFDRLYIDWHWAGRTKAWIIPGTEDLMPCIPAKVHLPCYIVIIATFVTVVQMVLQAFVPALYKSLGVYLALIVVNCIILGRAEMFACKNTVVDSALDGLGMGIGYILTMLLMSSIREIIGNGTWLGITIIPDSVDKMTVMNSAPGGFFVFGCLMAGCVWLERKLNKPIERKSCGDVMLEKIDAAKEEQKGGAEE